MKRWFFLILFVAVLLRFLGLGVVPAGLGWDEAAIGYNGFGIASVHRDEWLVKMPITFKSFGDYKAAVAIYLDAISTTIFGLNPFGIRFPMALAGVVTVIATFFIAQYIFQNHRFALLAMLFVAVSPINVHYSRIAFESGIAVAIVAVAVSLFLYAEKKPWIFYPASACLFAVSMYAYHSTKMTTPIVVFILFFVFVFRKRTFSIPMIVAAVLGFSLLLPIIRESLFANASSRFYMTSAIMDGKKLKPIGEIAQIVIVQTLEHLDPRFLLFGKSSTLRHGSGVFGVLGYAEYFLFLIGSFVMIFRREWRKYSWLLALFFVALLPAIITTDAPHSNRAHGMVPWVSLLATAGLIFLETKMKKIPIYLIVVGVTLCSTLFYAYEYVRIYSTVAASEFQYGYQEATAYAHQHESDVNSILLTSAYGQPYIYVLLEKKLTPIQWQQGALANYELRDITWSSDKDKKDILIIGTPNEIPADAPNIVKEVLDPAGKIVFRIVENK